MFFSGFLLFSTHISLDLPSLCSAEAYIGWGGTLNSHLLVSCVTNIPTKHYQNLIIGFSSYSQKSWGCFFRHSVETVWFYQPRSQRNSYRSIFIQFHSIEIQCWTLSTLTLQKSINTVSDDAQQTQNWPHFKQIYWLRFELRFSCFKVWHAREDFCA